jgi:CRISPR-associated protein Csm4
MKELLIRIKPKSAFPPLHSDTIFGAFCAAVGEIYGEEKIVEILSKFGKSPPFLISSAFPYVDSDEGGTYFFPKPIGELERLEDFKEYIDIAKELKKARYLSEEVFNSWINGEIDGEYLLRNFREYTLKMGLLFPKEKELKFGIRSVNIPRNQINRLSFSSENIFYFEGAYYENAGLFFITRIYEEGFEDILKGALRLLEDRGFGEDISVGKGHFELRGLSENAVLKMPKDGERFVTLSRYRPSSEELSVFNNRRDMFYELCTKRGRTSSGAVKKLVRYFVEGSTFPSLKKEIYGSILHVHHKSVEYGYAFAVGMLK